ncbi:hypothetical protein AAIR98_001909 [Elusimicrobium simillimum]|uniref:hypothetical protein n=1 Tax=Elusimicrobium simillimum TaxID=3143438 RepID=UPI003C6FBEDD
MVRNIKIFAVLLAGVFVFAACDSSSDSPSTQIFSVLNTQTATVYRDNSVTISSMDASVTTDGKGGMTVSTYVPVVSGGTIAWTKQNENFQHEDLVNSYYDAYRFKREVSDTVTSGGTTIDYTATNYLLVGGRRAGLKYGDFGYWSETVKANVTGDTVEANPNYSVTKRDWATFLVYDPAMKPTNLPTDNENDYTFSGRVLGGVDLYNSNGDFVETSAMSGDVTLNANFKDRTMSTDMSLTVGSDKWYDLNVSTTNGVQNDGSFTNASGGTINITGDYDQNNKYAKPITGGYSSEFNGQFLGEDGKIPAEVIGQFNLLFNSLNEAGYRPEVYGVFGAKR